MNILIVTSSAQGDASVSSKLALSFAQQAQSAHPGAHITLRDVGRNPIPHLTEETIAGVRAEPTTEAEHEARALSDELLDELRAADTVVIASPMYNFGISSTLKTWFDHVLRARVSFYYDEQGPHGLLGGRKAIVIESRAGAYEEGNPMDSQEPHLRGMLGFMGIDDVTFVRAEKLAFGPEAAAEAIAEAEAKLADLAREQLPLAA
ncbi:NAD(P)H-dependent oxidoreductase [Sphingosinicella sp. YJ22]|uniref:FMN-dependent NADH-azoreductase n=1 Tax=Sphingosinicella sp. YJ22 TaxID=1104780 RepID=UPI00140C9852|nr:NAD(P)H-dependent oxidoreductase [Sphingosinicella sp. YJ22]